MFYYAGQNATTWSVKIPKNTGSLNNTTDKFYGSSGSVYATPSGKSFTIPNNVSVVVQDGVLGDGEVATKTGWVGQDVTFNIVPNDSSKSGFVSCTNNQTGTFKNNVLTVSNITSDTTCTVTFDTMRTVLYNDGTLILNELGVNRASNISTHGTVTKEYEAMSDSNSYVFSTDANERPWANERISIKSVEFGSKIKPVATDAWFSIMDNFASISCYNLDTSETTSMEGMFASSSHNVQNIIFDLSNFNTGNVTSMVSMFEDLGSPSVNITLDLSGWNTSKVSNMTSMFKYLGRDASTINILGLDNWNVSNVTNTNEMFLGVGENSNGSFINIGNLTKWDTSRIEDMSEMFYGFGNENTKISSIGRLTIPYGAIIYSLVHSPGFVGDFFIDGSMANDSAVFDGAATVSGSKINLYYNNDDADAEGMVDKYIKEYGPNSSNKGNIYKVSTTNNNLTVNVVVQDGTLNDDATKEVAYGSNVSFNVVPGDSSLYGSVECENGTVGFIKNNVLTLKDVKNSDTCTVSYGETRTILYENGTFVINELISKIDEHSSLYGGVITDFEPMSDSNSYVFDDVGSPLWGDALPGVKKVIIGSSVKPLSLAYWFYSGVALESGEFYNLDTSETINVKEMFAGTGTEVTDEGNGYPDFILKGLDMWDTSKVTDFSGLFAASGPNSTVWNVGDISKWDTSSATDMSNMFGNAGYRAKIFNLNLSRWDTSKVTNMSSMFIDTGHDSAIFNLDLSGWDTSSVTNMSSMFSDTISYSAKCSIKIPKKTGNLTNTGSKWYGASDSVYAEPLKEMNFTLS